MATLVSDPVGRGLFEYWFYEALPAGRPAAVEDLFDATWQDGPLFYALQGSEDLRVAEGHISGSMAHEYVQLSTFMASKDEYHGIHALLRNRDWILAQSSVGGILNRPCHCATILPPTLT